jgi:adenosylhomocysteine nucleosidase
MPLELRPLVQKLDLHKDSIGALPVQRGTLGEIDVVAVKTGMGTALARQATQQLLGAVPVDHAVVVGIAGGIQGQVEVGDLVVPGAVVDGATGREYVPPEPLGGTAVAGKIRTGDDFLTDPDALARLAADGVVAVDMETSAVAAVCEERGVRWTAFRAISDMAGWAGFDESVLHLNNADGTPNPGAIAKFLVTKPWRIPLLARLARGSSRAADAAAEAAVRACRCYDGRA